MAATKSTSIIISDLLTFDASKHYKPIIVGQERFKELTDAEKKQLREKISILFKNMSSFKTQASLIFLFNEDRDTELVRSLVTKRKEIKILDLSKHITKGDRTQILYSHFQTFIPNENFSKVKTLTIKGIDSSLGYP